MPQQCLADAVEYLDAVGELPIQQRLARAGMALSPLLQRDFSDRESGERFLVIIDALTAREAVGGESSIEVTTARLGDQNLEKIAGQIRDLAAAYLPLD